MSKTKQIHQLLLKIGKSFCDSAIPPKKSSTKKQTSKKEIKIRTAAVIDLPELKQFDFDNKDIEELPSETHYETLTSYMTEKQIFDGINKRLGDMFRSKARVNFMVSNSPEAFKKNQVMTRYDMLRKMGIGG